MGKTYNQAQINYSPVYAGGMCAAGMSFFILESVLAPFIIFAVLIWVSSSNKVLWFFIRTSSRSLSLAIACLSVTTAIGPALLLSLTSGPKIELIAELSCLVLGLLLAGLISKLHDESVVQKHGWEKIWAKETC